VVAAAPAAAVELSVAVAKQEQIPAPTQEQPAETVIFEPRPEPVLLPEED
jgi:hypothetical protein